MRCGRPTSGERRLPCRQGHESSTGPAQKAGRTGRQEARGRREREEGGERNDYATSCWRHGAVNRSSPMYATPRPVCEGAPPLPVEGRSSPCSLRTCRVSQGRSRSRKGRPVAVEVAPTFAGALFKAGVSCPLVHGRAARRGVPHQPPKNLALLSGHYPGANALEIGAERLGFILRPRALKRPRNPYLSSVSFSAILY